MKERVFNRRLILYGLIPLFFLSGAVILFAEGKRAFFTRGEISANRKTGRLLRDYWWEDFEKREKKAPEAPQRTRRKRKKRK